VKLYVDASALVKLLIREAETPTAASLWLEADRVVSAATIIVEARAAVARRLTGRAAARATRELGSRLDAMEVAAIDDALLQLAASTAGRFRLRALDAVHLAAALEIEDESLVLATWDRELARAASSAGLAVAP
jgi:hypothetical protein